MAQPRMAAGLDDEFYKRAATLGKALVNQLAILIKVAQMHDLKNVAVSKTAEALATTVASLLKDRDSLGLFLIGEHFFIEESRVRYTGDDASNFFTLATEFRKKRLGSLRLGVGLDMAEAVRFAGAFLATPPTPEAFTELVQRLSQAGVVNITPGEYKPPKPGTDQAKSLDDEETARQAYVRAVSRVGDLMETVAAGRPPDIRMLKRATHALVDAAYEVEPQLLRLSAVRKDTDILPRHYVNVCVLSLLMGKRMGLSKFQMSRLAMAALLHDIGRLSGPEIQDDMDGRAWEIFKGHSRRGIVTLLKLKGLNEAAVSAMIVAYEHHRNMDGSGYPEQLEAKEMNIFSRVVRIADNYDATTSSGIYGIISLPPPKAIDIMRTRSGQYYDPELLLMFIGIMGIYPVGSFVVLSDGRAAIVSSPGRGPDAIAHPTVTVVCPGSPDTGLVVDLTEKDVMGGYKNDIAGVLDPSKCRSNIYRSLL